MSFEELFINANIWVGLAIFIFVIIAWVTSLVLRDTSIVDVFWGIGFIVVSAVFFFLIDGSLIRQLLVLILVMIWGLRLSTYIGVRNHGKPEDSRYRTWREKHGRKWPLRSLVTVFFFQGILMWIIAIPILVAQMPGIPKNLIWLDFVGITFWTIGFLFEAISDWQLFKFKKNPENTGKVLDKGLWYYTRHPNYFGEFLIWWGFGFIALTSGKFWVLVSPILISIMVMKYSGVNMLEKGLKSTKPNYDVYIRTTSTFFPWMKKKVDQNE